MPYGCLSAVPDVITEVHRVLTSPNLRTKRVLDCGAGSGIYGAMIRNWIDRGHPSNHHTYIMAIEGFSDYTNQPNYSHYNCIHRMTIQEWLKWDATKRDRFEVILLLDVLEHFEKPEGLEVLEGLQSRLAPGGALIVATPSVDIPQGAIWGNVLETHRALWTAEELEALGFRILEEGKQPNKYGHYNITAVCG